MAKKTVMVTEKLILEDEDKKIEKERKNKDKTESDKINKKLSGKTISALTDKELREFIEVLSLQLGLSDKGIIK